MDKLFDIKEKVVWVSGANGQLGHSIVETMTERGAYVCAIDLKSKDWQNDSVLSLNADIRNENEVIQVFRDAWKWQKRVDILINNAGVSDFEPFSERTEERFDWVMDVNLKGTFNCIRNYVANCIENGSKQGNIINIASFYGLVSPDPRIYTDCVRKNSEVYGATKAGVIQMTKYFAVHLAEHNIRVNAISPGGILNEENPQGEDFQKNYGFRCPMKRMAKAKELMGAVVYLASPASTYTNGHNLVVDGGFSAW